MLSAHPGPSTGVTAPPVLTSLLALADNPAASEVEYVIGGQQLTAADRELAAQLLADDAMRIRCGDSPALARWRARRDGGPPETGAAAEAVRVYAGIGFGLPGAATGDDGQHHLQGLVAELLWNRLIQERLVCRDKRRLVHAHSVKPDPLEPGGDGLVIYQADGGTLVFRLWEIKKHEPQNENLGDHPAGQQPAVQPRAGVPGQARRTRDRRAGGTPRRALRRDRRAMARRQ